MLDTLTSERLCAHFDCQPAASNQFAPPRRSDPMMLDEGIWGSAANDVWFVGDSGTVLHWDGSSLKPVNSNTSIGFKAISGAASGAVWAVGAGGVACWNGATWARETGATGSFLGVAAARSDNVWAVGASGAARWWNGSDWSAVPVVSGYMLNAVAAVGPNDVRAVGMAATILRGR